MKKLQNNYTTVEQSKRLLELGVPADSADCFYYKDANKPLANFIRDLLPENVNYSVRCSNHLMYDYLPCWSVGRLMEIAHICSNSNLSYKEEAEELKKFKEEHQCETIIEVVIMCIEDAYSIGGIDFSKLGE